MTEQTEALKMALEALEKVHQDPKGWWNCHVEITAIQAALAQPEKWTPEDMAYRPGALVRTEPDPTPEQLAALGWQSIECPFCGTSGAQAFPKPECDWEGIAADQAMTIALMRSEQEPVAWLKVVSNWWGAPVFAIAKPNEANAKPVYTAPPKRQPLTDEELQKLRIEQEFDQWAISENVFKHVARAIEAKLKEKNT